MAQRWADSDRISRIWRAFGLQPHRSRPSSSRRTRCSSRRSATLWACICIRPTGLVLCVDEKSQIQALDRTQPLLPMRPGQPERRTHDYCGMARPRCSPRST